jgi:flagellar hook protein FlgE
MLAVSALALSGLSAAQATLRVSAHNVANLATDAPCDALETDVVAQLQAKNAFLANLAVFRTHDRMMGELLDARA